MARAHAWLVISFLSLATVGCVSDEKYKTVGMDRDQYAMRLAVAEREKAEAIASRDALKSQIDNVGNSGTQKDALVLNYSNQLSDLQRRYEELQQRYADAAKNVGISVQLPEVLNKAIKQFAADNPDLVTYDEGRGIVKFKSDVTFAPGSAILTSAAASAIDRFAGIVNSPAAAGYELMVVGHTDNVPVSHEATKAAGHKDNWYLSAHRAISVSEQLRREAVSPARLEVAGCADERPVAPNTDAAGRAQNRRVEVLILSTTVHSSVAASPAPTGTAIPAGNRVSKSTEINKDNINKDAPPATNKPVFNK
jgi:chemotaxis protein MotB